MGIFSDFVVPVLHSSIRKGIFSVVAYYQWCGKATENQSFRPSKATDQWIADAADSIFEYHS